MVTGPSRNDAESEACSDLRTDSLTVGTADKGIEISTLVGGDDDAYPIEFRRVG
ncbi:hypothetical protein [Streptomyces bohaiensis]|uniref:hypothetical protein n=1 Tax=Streptomyces bohaiensis TaxID=1431344 RepID=UPI003B794B8B